MNIFHLPDLGDTRDTIADCLTALRSAPAGQHERIIENCLVPVSMLFLACKMASAAGPDEGAVFGYFLTMMEAQANAAAMTRGGDYAGEAPGLSKP